ncbi:protein of unknown function DUF167 [Ferroglobus placidus DSM 10642]|uniref:UPF0235 protein Ferp_1433 n=2 Tax=Ferroglobus placidus TaxID=54261 RepID=D3RYM1_FERPA|nr:protein of unknown function DUF167 [Ferroglobus placidus DSM 10642]
MGDWLEEVEEGVIITVHVTPSSKKNEIAGYDPWKKALSVKVKAPPVEGKANRELEKFLKEYFGKNVKLVSGEKSRVKKVLIVGCSREEVEKHVG